MEIREGAKRFYIIDNEKEIGEVTYTHAGDAMIILDHTYVNPDYRGQKLAEKLVKKVVDKAIQENWKVVPLCPFAKREFDKKPEYQAIQK